MVRISNLIIKMKSYDFADVIISHGAANCPSNSLIV